MNRINIQVWIMLEVLLVAALTVLLGARDIRANQLEQHEAKAQKVTSRDGTPIAFEQSGKGPAVILVAGALSDRHSTARLAALLAPQFTVISYDRRDSGDAKEYAVAREIEDLEALIDHAGGNAFVFGTSSGAALALEAGSKLPGKIRKLALHEPPFVVDDSRQPVPPEFVTHVSELVAAGKRSEAVEYFMADVIGVPRDFVAQMKQAPTWPSMEKLAHTIAYDGTLMGNTQSGKPLPAGRWSTAAMPVLVIDGGNSDAFLQNAARAITENLPHAQHRTLDGQDHAVAIMAPQAIAPVLIEFFNNQKDSR